MGRIWCHPAREPHRPHRNRRPERHRLVYRRRVDRHRDLVSETETEHGIFHSRCVYGDTPYRVDLRCNLDEAEEEG